MWKCLKQIVRIFASQDLRMLWWLHFYCNKDKAAVASRLYEFFRSNRNFVTTRLSAEIFGKVVHVTDTSLLV